MLLLNKLLGLVPMTYNEGGGKGAPATPETPKPVSTTTSIGNQLEGQAETADSDTIDKESAVDKKKLGTRGLQIPLTAPSTATVAPATTGIQV